MKIIANVDSLIKEVIIHLIPIEQVVTPTTV